MEKQKLKLAEHQQKQVLVRQQELREEESKKKKERQQRQKQQQEHEKKKKMIQDYKVNKLVTEDLLANADLDGFGNYGEGQEASSDEEEANQVMD